MIRVGENCDLRYNMINGKFPPFVEISNLLATSDSALVDLTGGVVAIGNFDGVHKGHRVVLDTAGNLATQNAHRTPAVVMTFEPHPRTVFNPSKPVFRLTPPSVKARLFKALGLQGSITELFARDFANMSADAFVEELLVKKLKVAHVVVGYDFHFGKARQGSPEFLMEMGEKHSFGVSIVPAQKDEAGDFTFSSSATRSFIEQGAIEKANNILGYRYFVSGEIIHGEKRGRTLGYPTANMVLPAENTLRHGIYAVQMRIDGKLMDGVASFGRRPTFDNGAALLETFVFDFDGDLYGSDVEIIFVKFLRGEEKFDDLDALISQMDKDCTKARLSLKNAPAVTSIDEALNQQMI